MIDRTTRRIAALALALTVIRAAGATGHPLDPLSGDEITAAVAVLRDAGLVDDDARFPQIDLDEPAKAVVLAWQPGRPERRSAFIVARRNRTVYEGVVDLAAKAVTRWRETPLVQSSILVEEIEAAQRATIADPGWQAAMRRRGYTRFDTFFCAPLSIGPVTDPALAGRRLLNMVCFDDSGNGHNLWARPVEGLYAVVDLDRGAVVRLVDGDAVPVSRDPADFPATSGAVAGPATSPASGAGFVLDGNEVRWKHWSYRFRLDRRAGPIVSLVRFDDRGRQRLVLYRGSIAEMFVPYMDPDEAWSFRAYMDVGEYGFGVQASPLKPGVDCPATAGFIAATLPDDRGMPVTLRSRLCLFERATGDPLWRHAEFSNRSHGGAAATELVLRSIAAVGNYDYVVDWVLTEAGAIRVDIGATGIDAVKGVGSATLGDPAAARDTAHGTLVAPDLAAINHDHFLSLRLDVDIDGEDNMLVRRVLRPQRLAGDGARRSLWRVVDEIIGEEGPLAADMPGGAGTWLIVNPNRTNRLGQHPAYELRGERPATSLLAPDDPAQRRGAFSAAPLWITAFDPAELYAAGAYPNQNAGLDGLPAYVARQRPVTNADIVLWCTIGFHHAPRPEDWPVMATQWHSLSLVPDGFFDRNPAIDPAPDQPSPGQPR